MLARVRDSERPARFLAARARQARGEFIEHAADPRARLLIKSPEEYRTTRNRRPDRYG
jgi:hypothetical protein